MSDRLHAGEAECKEVLNYIQSQASRRNIFDVLAKVLPYIEDDWGSIKANVNEMGGFRGGAYKLHRERLQSILPSTVGRALGEDLASHLLEHLGPGRPMQFLVMACALSEAIDLRYSQLGADLHLQASFGFMAESRRGGLNSDESLGCVLPRLSGVLTEWSRRRVVLRQDGEIKHQRDTFARRIENFVFSEPVTGVRIDWRMLDAHVSSLLEPHAQLRILPVPLIIDWDEVEAKTISGDGLGYNGRQLHVSRLADERRIAQRVIDIIDFAGERSIDVIVFPEASVTQAIVRSVEAHLEEREYPKLVICGSYYLRQPSGLYASCSEVLGPGGMPFWEQRKLEPYEMSVGEITDLQTIGVATELQAQPSFEALDPWAKEMRIRDLPGHGRSVVLICSDFALPQPLHDALISLRVNCVFVPAMVKDALKFKSRAEHFAREGQSATVISANCCWPRSLWKRMSDTDQPRIISFVCLPSLPKTEEEKVRRHMVCPDPRQCPGERRLDVDYPDSQESATPRPPCWDEFVRQFELP